MTMMVVTYMWELSGGTCAAVCQLFKNIDEYELKGAYVCEC